METYRTLTINQQINLAYYCGCEKILSPRSFSIAAASAPVAPSIPTPMTVCKLLTHIYLCQQAVAYNWYWP